MTTTLMGKLGVLETGTSNWTLLHQLRYPSESCYRTYTIRPNVVVRVNYGL